MTLSPRQRSDPRSVAANISFNSRPLAEVASYASQLKSVTGGQGSYAMEFNRYDVVPPNVQQQIVGAELAEEEED